MLGKQWETMYLNNVSLIPVRLNETIIVYLFIFDSLNRNETKEEKTDLLGGEYFITHLSIIYNFIVV